MTDTLPAIRPRPDVQVFELDQRRAKAYAESGYWPDVKQMAQALVKVEAGRELGLPALVAMSEVHVIDGKPSLGAGALAPLVKAHPRYDYRVTLITNLQCAISFIDRTSGEVLGDSVFTIEDAGTAGLLNKGPWKQYPRNMLFARAISNGVAWFCPDVTMGRVYVPEELGVPPTMPDEVEYADMGTVDDPVEEEIEWPDALETGGENPSDYPPADGQAT